MVFFMPKKYQIELFVLILNQVFYGLYAGLLINFCLEMFLVFKMKTPFMYWYFLLNFPINTVFARERIIVKKTKKINIQ